MRNAAIGLVALLALRAAYLTVVYLGGFDTTIRPQVESTCLLFVLAGLALRIATTRGNPPVEGRVPPSLRWTATLWICGALLLYWPAVSIGLLSDDFGLFDRASRLDLSPINSEAFRPVPLVIWAGLLSLGGGDATLHILNIALHGLNAYLTTRVVGGYAGHPWPVMAGLVMLTLPVAPEAVVWCSGVFDVVATFFVLICVLVARAYDSGSAIGRRLALGALAVAGVLSKETAVTIPLMLFADAWGRKRLRRPLTVDLSVLTLLLGVYGVIRLLLATPSVRQSVTRYTMQRAVFGLFSGLAVPWHVEAVSAHPFLPVASALIVLGVAAAFFMRSDPGREATRGALVSACWMAIPVLPAISFLFIAGNLEGSRHLYTSSVGWAALVAILAANEPSRASDRSRLGLAPIGLLVVLAVTGVRIHLSFWQAASDLRDQVETAAKSDPRLVQCGTVTLHGLPDSVSGAYVFRNGAPEAFARDVGLGLVGSTPGPCVFRWTGSRFEGE